MSTPFILVNDFGICIDLLIQSPGMVKKYLREGVFRNLEREASLKYSVPGRLCFDPVCTALASKKYTAQQKLDIQRVSNVI